MNNNHWEGFARFFDTLAAGATIASFSYFAPKSNLTFWDSLILLGIAIVLLILSYLCRRKLK
ncbi:MAG: hypothetical protein QM537_09500 [Candidatus Symbiobacter sp.]|nr:hypothetical protein [Candidatus Symbiobacter sp.]